MDRPALLQGRADAVGQRRGRRGLAHAAVGRAAGDRRLRPRPHDIRHRHVVAKQRVRAGLDVDDARPGRADRPPRNRGTCCPGGTDRRWRRSSCRLLRCRGRGRGPIRCPSRGGRGGRGRWLASTWDDCRREPASNTSPQWTRYGAQPSAGANVSTGPIPGAASATAVCLPIGPEAEVEFPRSQHAADCRNPGRSVRSRRHDRRRRDGRGLSRPRREAESRRRAEGAARVARPRSGSARAVPARSAGAGLAQPSEHRPHPRASRSRSATAASTRS